MRRFARVSSLAAVLLTAAAAFAVRPQAWTHQTEQDFADGTFDNVVVNSYGELILGRELKAVTLGSPVEMVTGIALGGDGALYAATLPDGKVFRIADGKAKAWYDAPESSPVTAIAADAKGNILLALSDGKKAKFVQLAAGEGKPKATTLFEKDGVEHIWAVASQGQDIYVGTGPKGIVYKITAGGAAEVALDTHGRNAVSLAFDPKGRLIAGTDSHGLVIRRDDNGKPFVLHDAGKVDITALAFDDDGNLYAAAAKSESDSSFDFPNEGPGTKSKPGKVEPEPADDVTDDFPTTSPKGKPAPKLDKPKKPASTERGDASLLPMGIHADQKAATERDDWQSLLQLAKPRNLKDGPPTTRRRPPATGKLGIGTGSKHKPLRKLPRFDDFEPEPSNAVYKIAPDGTVSTIVSGEPMNMSLLWNAAVGELVIGTGTEGRIHTYKPGDESKALVARVKEDMVTALTLGKDGTLYVGASDLGAVYTLSASLAKKGTYISKPLDATRPAFFGSGTLALRTPGETKVTIATRSTNVREPAADRFWTPWSAESDGNAATFRVASPTGRYLQYRVTLTGEKETPAVESLRVTYQVPNLAPVVKNLVVETGEFFEAPDLAPAEGEADRTPPITISWDATDPNHDTLVYRVYCKPAGDKDDAWTLTAKDLKEATYDWNAKGLADGKYQVKVIASDSPDNTPETAKSAVRVSSTFVIDRTPPALGELKTDIAEGKVTISGEAKDALTAVVDVRFQIDAQQDWQPATPSDKMFDSLTEAFTAVTRVLPPGGHRITVRATDAAGNVAYKSVTVSVPAK